MQAYLRLSSEDGPGSRSLRVETFLCDGHGFDTKLPGRRLSCKRVSAVDEAVSEFRFKIEGT